MALSNLRTDAGFLGELAFFSNTTAPVFSSITITDGLESSLLDDNRSKIDATEFGSSACAAVDER